MANRPIDDFDPRNPKDEAATHDEPQELIDDEADFGGTHSRSRHAQADHDDAALHDDADFVDDDMNDIVDDADPLADTDDDTHYGEHDEADEDTSDDDDQGGVAEEAQAEMARSRTGIGSIIFYIIIAGVVAGGGYMAYRTFTTGGEPVSPNTVMEAASNTASKAAGVVVPTDANAPTPAPIPADNSNPLPSAGTPVEASNNGWQTTLPDEPATAQTASPAVMPTTANGAPAAPLAATVANTEAMTGLNARLADTESRLANMTANVATLQMTLQASQAEVASLKQRQAQPTAVTAPPSISDSDLAALRADNASLQKKVEQLTRSQQTLQAQLQTASTRVSSVEPAAPKPVASPKTTAPKAKVVKQVETSAMVADDSTPRSPKTRAPAAGKTNWVLRAATPGMAWVSPQPGSAELKRVVPGDSLPGIGQVTAIRQENGRWIVEGSGGVIR